MYYTIINYFLAISFMANQSFLNQIRRLRGLEPIEFQRRVNINPMWYDGSREEVHASFERLRRALAYHNQFLDERIDEVKRERYVSDVGMSTTDCFNINLY